MLRSGRGGRVSRRGRQTSRHPDHVLRSAGLRISEAVRLTVSAIDSQRMVLQCRQRQGAEGPLRDLSPKQLPSSDHWSWWAGIRHWLFPGARSRHVGHSRPRVGLACRLCLPTARDSPNAGFASIRSAMRLPSICLRPAPTCARFSSCSATGVCRRRRSTCGSRRRCARPRSVGPARRGRPPDDPFRLSAGRCHLPRLTVADVFRRYGDAFRSQARGHPLDGAAPRDDGHRAVSHRRPRWPRRAV